MTGNMAMPRSFEFRPSYSLAALLAVVTALLIWGTWDRRSQSQELVAATQLLKERKTAQEREARVSQADPLAALPPASSHMDDLALLFELADRHHLGNALTASHSKERLREAAVALNKVELSLDATYSDVKPFIADVLRKSRNAYLSGFRADGAVASNAARQRFVIQLTFAYREPPALQKAGKP